LIVTQGPIGRSIGVDPCDEIDRARTTLDSQLMNRADDPFPYPPYQSAGRVILLASPHDAPIVGVFVHSPP
jgi:hypothetical protein